MISKPLLNISLKIIGVFYSLSALNMLPATISQTIIFWNAWHGDKQHDVLGLMANYKIASLAGLFIPILLFFFSLLIIFKSEKIASFLLKKEGPLKSTRVNDFSTTALNLSIKIFGFFSILSSIPYASNLLSSYWVMKDDLRLYDNRGKIDLASSGISVVLYVCIGLILIFYSRKIADKLLKTESKNTKRVQRFKSKA